MQAGEKLYIGVIRSQEVLECPIGCLAVLLIHQYTIKRTAVPDISTEAGMEQL